jgi:hypothetical protein
VDVLGHDDVAEDVELIFLAGGFESVFKDAGRTWGGEVRIAAVTTEGDEVEVVGLLAAFQARGHLRINLVGMGELGGDAGHLSGVAGQRLSPR